MVAKHGKNISTYASYDSQLWLEAWSTDGFDMNQVYGMPMALT